MSNGKSAALVGALLGLGLGEAAPKTYRAGMGGKNAYNGDNPTGVSNANDYVDSLLGTSPSQVVQPQIRRLPPVDQGGQPLDSLPEGENQGDIAFQALPSMGGDMVDVNAQHPDKFDTTTGDALQTQRKARTYRAISDAARINEILGTPQVSRQQAAGLIRDYHQKYPDINIPIQPYTSQQATELRNRAILEQHRDEAEAQGFDRSVYSGVDQQGQPIINKLIYQKHFDERQQAIAERASAREGATEKARQLIEADKVAKEHALKERDQIAQERVQAQAVHQALIKAAGKPPKAPDAATAAIDPGSVSQYKKDLADYQSKVDFANKQLFSQFGYNADGTKVQNPAAPTAGSQPSGAGMATPVPAGIQAAHASQADVTPAGPPQEVARKKGIPFVKDPSDIQKLNLQPGDQFIGPSGVPKRVPGAKTSTTLDPMARIYASRNTSPIDDTMLKVMMGQVKPEVAMTWHTPEEQNRIKQSMGDIQTALQEYGIKPGDTPIQIAEKLNAATVKK